MLENTGEISQNVEIPEALAVIWWKSKKILPDLFSRSKLLRADFSAKMPPKGAKGDKGPSKKTEQKKKEKIVEVWKHLPI